MKGLSFGLVALMALAGCGGQTVGLGGVSGDSGNDLDTTPMHDGSSDANADLGEPGRGVDAGLAMGGGRVDAGYYHGDGSFWVEGGAYRDLPDASSPPGPDAAAGDASSGCGALSACCITLTASSKPLCESIAASGNAANCSTELTMLQAAGSCTGVTVLASGIQVPPYLMVSDGTLLFWTTESNPGLEAMPVRGGTVTTLVAGPLRLAARFGGDQFLTVDAANIYALIGSNLVRMPKNGQPPTAVNESGALIISATTLGTTAYWTEASSKRPGGVLGDQDIAVKSAPLLGTSVFTVAKYYEGNGGPFEIAVTSTTAFTAEDGSNVRDFPLTTGAPGGHRHPIDVFSCGHMTSDTDAVYCPQQSGSNLRIASDGTITSLGPAINSTYLAFDDTYVYWADATTVGAIVKAPKIGGGTATTLAHDTSPVAIAVDGTSIYWADVGGYIKRIAK